MGTERLFTSESVTEGHPDKLCDRISDEVLDAHLARDPEARVACETLAAGDTVTIVGEISSKRPVPRAKLEQVVRKAIRDVGYNESGKSYFGFSADTCKIDINLAQQSPDIAQGVNDAHEHRVENANNPLDQVGAGDQGLMFGYACNETPEKMPLAIVMAHALTRRLAEVRKLNEINYLRPDGKAQVTLRYDGDKPVGVDTIVVSTQHHEGIGHGRIVSDIAYRVVFPILREYMDSPRSLSREDDGRYVIILADGSTAKLFVNPTGKFVVGGPVGDAGLTGRKIIVDTYGGASRHGGGAFSGKDATKVDRSGAYAARHVARNVVAAGFASHCEVQLAYAIGVAHPVSVYVNTYGTGDAVPDNEIADAVNKVFDLRPAAIIERFGLRFMRFSNLSAYGHVGRTDIELPWERETHVEKLLTTLGFDYRTVCNKSA